MQNFEIKVILIRSGTKSSATTLKYRFIPEGIDDLT